MALLLASEIVDRDHGRGHELADFDRSLRTIHDLRPPIVTLAERLADAVRRHGYDSRQGVLASIDECLLASFKHCGERFDIDKELVEVNRDEPNLDKFPDWLPSLSPNAKCLVGKHMARHDIPSGSPMWIDFTAAGSACITFASPGAAGSANLVLDDMVGARNPFSALPSPIAEALAVRQLNGANAGRRHGGPPPAVRDVMQRSQAMAAPRAPSAGTPFRPHSLPPDAVPYPPSPFADPYVRDPGGPASPWPLPPHLTRPPRREYMAGLGRFLTAARLQEQLQGERAYSYADATPTVNVDPTGRCWCAPNLFDLHMGWVTIDCSCKGWLIGIVPEHGSGVVRPVCGKTYPADGIWIGETLWKIAGAPCVTVMCHENEVIIDPCINWLLNKLLPNDCRPPLIVPSNTWPNRIPPGGMPLPVASPPGHRGGGSRTSPEPSGYTPGQPVQKPGGGYGNWG